ncbi:MAG: amino acid permease [Gaiellaceae bacterium]
MSTESTGGYRTSEDEKILHKLGYAQELFRAMGGFQNFAISFTIISILAGCLTSYYIAFESGGPIAVTWGWLLIGLFSTIISLAMAEIASSFPTAGGLYYWASKLGSPGWGWATGWFNLIGQIAVTAAIGYGLATFSTVLFDDLFSFEKHMNDWFGLNYNETVYALYAVFLLAVCLINVFDVRITAMLNTVSAYWHMVGVAVIVIVLIVVPKHHQSASYVFGGQANATGYGGNATGFHHAAFWLVFGLGLLMAQYTITGFDASAHMAEETHRASRMAAVGMYMSVVVSVIFGFVLLVAVTFAIPPAGTAGVLDNIGAAVPWIWKTAMSENWSDALLAICVVAQFFCLTASTTSASRMMFAFSRDGAVPGHPLWRRVSKHRVPVYAVFAIGVMSGLLMVPAIWNYLVGYAAGTAIAVIGLYIAFVLPVFLRLRLGDKFEHGAWSLGKHYKWIDTIALIWVAIITVLFSLPLFYDGLPWSPNFSWTLTNYTVLWFAGIGLCFGGWWVLSAHKWFKGPVRMGTEEELEQLEAKQEGAFLLPADTGYETP